MTKGQKAKIIESMLFEFFPSPIVPLKHSDPFTLLIAVLLSAQCTDERVNQVTPELFAKAPTPKNMAALSPEEVATIIRSCGLYRQKSKAIVSLSKMLIENFNSIVPNNLNDLKSLPGVGHKTASVVMVQAFSTPAFPVDTHIHRLAKRWGLSKASSVKETEKDLKELFPKDKWGLIHLQIIYYARKFCTARGHEEKRCPICAKLKELKIDPKTAP